MNLRKKHLGLCTLLLISIVMAACTPTPTPAPTVDVNALYTQAAVTMVAQLTQNAPTITPTVPATNTPMPTVPPLPTMGALPTLPPLSTPTGAAVTTADKAMYITQTPADNTSVKTGQTFNIIWRLRNVGTTTWNTNYVYRFYSASNKIPTSANGYNLPSTVAPNQEVELKVVATAPSSTGTYDTRWVITNPEGTNFAAFDLTVNVIQGTTSGGGTEPTAAAPANPCSDKNYAWGGDNQGVDSTVPVTVSVQGGQVYLAYTKGTTGTGTFAVSYDGVNVLENIPVGNTGTKWFGEPDQESHDVIITVTGTGSISVTMMSINTNSKCY